MEATLKEFLNHAPVFVRRPDGEILHWTEGCAALFGFSADEAEGRNSHELLQTVFPEPLKRIEAAVETAGEWSGRLRHTTRSGANIWTLSVWRFRHGTNPSGPIIVEQNSDITRHVELEAQSALLMRELEHRVKNLLAVVQALARMSFPDAPAEQRGKFEHRLQALAEANRLLREASWEEAPLVEVITEVASALGIPARIRLNGDPVTIASDHVMGLALAVHELATNAIKYGALSKPDGHVEISWAIDPASPGQIDLQWREHGGPLVRTPAQTGFGTRLIRHAVAMQIDTPVDLRFEPDGVVCRLRVAGRPLAEA